MIVSGIPFVQGRNRYSDGDRSKYGIAIHNTSNDASDNQEASYATRRPDGISSHFYVDGDSITQSIDTKDRAGHAGSTHGNDHGIAVEITGANGWSREQWLSRVAWNRLATVLAQVIRHHWPDPKNAFQVRRATVEEMKANPKIRAFYGHDDMRRAWGGTSHTDPGPNFPWDHLIKTVKAALDGDAGEEDEMPSADDVARALLKAKLSNGRTVNDVLVTSFNRLPTDLATLKPLIQEAIKEAAEDPKVEVQPMSDSAVQALADRIAAKLPVDNK